MRKILLTSSQVSMLATAGLITLCAIALFVSGYAIQQRTLKELRAAIRPRESPKIHLPEEFRNSLSGLDEKTQIIVENEAQRWSREARNLKAATDAFADDAEIQVEETPQEEVPQGEASQIESTPENNDNEQKKIETAPMDPNGEATAEQMALLDKIQKSVADKSWAVENPDPLSKSKAPLTRAERRKMIKAEIRRLAQDDRPVYYQRRLW